MVHKFRRMLAEEDGSVTLWNLFWFTGFCAFFGLAMDSTSAMLMKSRLQSTADAAALAGIMGLKPNESVVDADAGLAGATSFALLNMDPSIDGTFISEQDIVFGAWDFELGTFDAGTAPENAVRVVTRREESSGNPLITTFLRVISFYGWDINAEATAAVEYEQCFLDGLISASRVVMDSSNVFLDRFCVYGREGVQLVNGNDFTGVDTHAYAGYGRGFFYECGFFLMGTKGAPPECSMESNPGLEEGWFVSDAIHPTRLLALDANGEPERDIDGNYIVTLGEDIATLLANAQAGTTLSAAAWRSTDRGVSQPVAAVTEQLMSGGAFYLECDSEKDVLEMTQGDYRNLLLATNCLLELPGGSPSNPPIYENVVFTSTSSQSFNDTGIWKSLVHNIAVRGGNQLGTSCEGFGVKFFTESGIKFDGGNIHIGTEVNAGGSVGIDGDNDGASSDLHSITVHALGDIIMTSNNRYALCDTGGASADAKPVYRLVN